MAKEESVVMTPNSKPVDDSNALLIRRGRVESVDLYEIKDTELDTLEKGTPAELQLNFAIFLWSIAFGAITSLATTTFPSKTMETTFIIVSVVGVLLGAYLMGAWWRTRSEVRELCKKIRQRIPPDVAERDEEPEEPEALSSINETAEPELPPQG